VNVGQAGLWYLVDMYIGVTVSEVGIKLCAILRPVATPYLTNIDCRDGVRQVNEGNFISYYISNTFLEL
jgi:hypothetical protein